MNNNTIVIDTENEIRTFTATHANGNVCYYSEADELVCEITDGKVGFEDEMAADQAAGTARIYGFQAEVIGCGLYLS